MTSSQTSPTANVSYAGNVDLPQVLPANQNLNYTKHPYAEAAAWLPLELARERYFGGEPLAKSEFGIKFIMLRSLRKEKARITSARRFLFRG